MRNLFRYFASSLLVLALLLPLVFTGCAARVTTGYRYYDRDHDDYHVWTNDEIVFYTRWENETHRSDRDFHKRGQDEQREYWEWRHNQR